MTMLYVMYGGLFAAIVLAITGHFIYDVVDEINSKKQEGR